MVLGFWGYSLAMGLLSYGQSLLEHKRLAVVFDLDETLLQAFTEKTLRERGADMDGKMWVSAGGLSRPGGLGVRVGGGGLRAAMWLSARESVGT